MKHTINTIRMAQDVDGRSMLTIHGSFARKVYVGDELVFEALPFHDLSLHGVSVVQAYGETYVVRPGTFEMQRWNAARWWKALTRREWIPQLSINSCTFVEVKAPRRTQTLSRTARVLLWLTRAVRL